MADDPLHSDSANLTFAAEEQQPCSWSSRRDPDIFIFRSGHPLHPTSTPSPPFKTSSTFSPVLRASSSSPTAMGSAQSSPSIKERFKGRFAANPNASPSWMARPNSFRESIRSRRRRYSAPFNSLPGRGSVSAHTSSPLPRGSLNSPLVEHPEFDAPLPPKTSPPDTGYTPRLHRNLSSPLPSIDRVSAFDIDLITPLRQPSPPKSASPSPVSPQPHSVAGSAILSSPLPAINSKPHRLSLLASSERASTVAGSDNDTRGFTSGEESDMDNTSDTLFDSLRTGTTNSSLGVRGPRIETIFDGFPIDETERGGLDALRDLRLDDQFVGEEKRPRHSMDDENLSTPGKGKVRSMEDSYSTPVQAAVPRAPKAQLPSSPPVAAPSMGHDASQWVNDHDERDTRWSLDDDEDEYWRPGQNGLGISSYLSSLSSGQALKPQHESSMPVSATSELTHANVHANRNAVLNLYEWSEQSVGSRESRKDGSARPNTDHGRRAHDGRGSRAAGRRGPSALHVRSQSVPVIPDVDAKRDLASSTNKYGTWNLGSKGASEDWNDDFVFEFPESLVEEQDVPDDRRVDSGISMFVPQAIQESQASVIGHLGHIKEFALLVEDLKRLRTLAASQGIIHGPSAALWKEADGIIDLAELDNDEEEYNHSLESSPGHSDDGINQQKTRTRRRSVLALEDDIFGGLSEESHTSSLSNHTRPLKDGPLSATASRKSSPPESSLVAKSVIANIHQRRTSQDPTLSRSDPVKPEKIKFDTTTLQDLVAHVKTLTRTLGDLLRETEKPTSPSQNADRSPTPSLSQIFIDPNIGSSPNSTPRLPRSKSNGVINGAVKGKENGMNGSHMGLMAII